MARPGIQDPDIIPLLHRGTRPTLFTHDQDYFKRALVHPAYCLVWLDLYDGDAAIFIRRFLRHPDFNSHGKRLGTVVRLHPHRITFWQMGKHSLPAILIMTLGEASWRKRGAAAAGAGGQFTGSSLSVTRL